MTMSLFVVYESVPECPACVRGVYTSREAAEARRDHIIEDEEPCWSVSIDDLRLDEAEVLTLHFAQRVYQGVSDASF